MANDANQVATLNAKVGAVGMLAGAIALHFLNQFAPHLVPLRLVSLGVVILGAWAFSDEMGLRKPLNRAAFISFIFSMAALGATMMIGAQVAAKFYLLYVFALLFAMLIWSTAFLHRKRDVKLAGAIGAAATLIPIVILVTGHVSIAAGAFFGINALMNLSSDTQLIFTTPIKVIEALFIFWSAAAAYVLWSGRVSIAGEQAQR